MKDQGKIQFNPEHTRLFPPQKLQEGFWVPTAWIAWKTGGDGHYNNWYKWLSGPVSQPLVSHFQETQPSVLKATKGQSILLGKEKQLSQGSGRMLVRIQAAIGQISQEPLPLNAA